MDVNDMDMTRRNLFIAAGLGTVALSLGGQVEAAEKNPNIKIVEDFCAAWNDPDKAVAYLSDDAAVRMVEDQPAVVGPAAVAGAFKGFMSHGETISVKILTSKANGPVVVNTRVDTLKTPGKPDQAFKVVGVFIVKKGKIKEWSDYLDG